MLPNIEKYKKDIDNLLKHGNQLSLSLQYNCNPDELSQKLRSHFGDKTAAIIKALPSFRADYQSWYSEAKVLIKQLLPDRLADFVRHYEKPRSRKDLSYENYRIEDYLQGIRVTRGDTVLVDLDAAIPHFEQQIAIVKSVKQRFESSLFDIRQLVQADLLDSELDKAKLLAKNGFTRAAGAVAGVVLERHLRQVCENHDTKITKKAPGIADLNNALKEANVIEVPQWRFVQHLADIRNVCDHDKKTEPTSEQVEDLIAGVTKITKTLY